MIPLSIRQASRILPLLLLGAAAFAPLLAERGPHHRSFRGGGAGFDEERMERLAEHQAERLTRALDLSPAQQVQLGKLQDQLEAAIEPLGETMRSSREQLRTLLEQESPDPAAVGLQAIAADRARDSMRAAWERFETDFTATLSETQRAGYRALQETRPGKGFDGGPGRHRGDRRDASKR